MEELFVQLADRLGMLVEMTAVLVVAYGSIEAFVQYFVAATGEPVHEH